MEIAPSASLLLTPHDRLYGLGKRWLKRFQVGHLIWERVRSPRLSRCNPPAEFSALWFGAIASGSGLEIIR